MNLELVNERINEYAAGFELAARKREMVNLARGLELLESVGDYIDPSWQFATESGFGSAASPWITEKRDGGNEPNFRTEQELQTIRGNARLIVDSNSYAVGIIENLVNYVIATGFVYEISAKKNVVDDPVFSRKLKRWIEEFQDENDWNGWEEELFKRERQDGEWFLRFFHTGSGHVQVRIVEPDQITETGHDEVHVEKFKKLSWSYGILTPDNDTQHVLGYNVVYDMRQDSEFVHADEILHSKVNVFKNVKRGMSDFFPVDSDLRAAKTLMRNSRDGAALQAAIAWIEQFPEGTRKNTVEAINNGKVDFTEIARVMNGSTKQKDYRKFEGGKILQIPKGKEYLPGPAGSERNVNFMLVLQGALRGCAVRWQMAEFMVSGSAENANYSSTMVAESPFVRTTMRNQGRVKKKYIQVLKTALGLACESGRFGDACLSDILEVYDITATEVSPEVRDRDKETARNQTLNRARIMSKKTWAAREDLDLEDEEKLIQDEEPSPMDEASKAIEGAMNDKSVDAEKELTKLIGE